MDNALLSCAPSRTPQRHTLRGRCGAVRRLLLAACAGLLTTAALLLGPALASADSASTLTVVGTSDVSDSGLIPNLIQPEFAKAYPQFTFKYIGTASGTAISDAESGSLGASALIVHAASLENQFVANGYSYNSQYGAAIFRNDFVLAGPKADPAAVTGNAAANIVQAFADIAAAGSNGGGAPRITFVSRGGTPGTTVEEHGIWALVQSSGLAPAGLLLCTVGSAQGGGETPIAAGNGVTASGQPCPGGGVLPTATQLPKWYAATGLQQGPNVVAANACNGFPSGANTCYVLSDRGTYDYLASGTDPLGAIPNLTILTRGPQSASAPGGADELINYFHAYIINPGRPGETVNLPAAQAFVAFVTSPAFQSQLASYLATTDPGGPPFVADASPTITATGIPRVYHAGRKVTATGTVTNNEIGYPVLADKPVTIDELAGATLIPVPGATTTTNSTGAYSLSFVPPTTGSYEVATPPIAQIESATLSPVFGDLLSPAATAPVAVTVHSAIIDFRVKPEGARAAVLGTVAPGSGHVKASVTVYAREGTKGGFRAIATARLSSSDASFAIAIAVGLAPARWQFKVKYQDPQQVVGTTSKTVKLTVGAKPTASVRLKTAKVKSGRVTVSGSVRPKAATSRTRMELLALRTSGTSARFAEVATVRIAKGKTQFTLHARLKRGYRWVLQLEYLRPGQTSSYSSLKTVTVT